MRKVVVLALVVSAVLTFSAAAASRDTDPGDVMHRILVRLQHAVIHVLDEVGLPKP